MLWPGWIHLYVPNRFDVQARKDRLLTGFTYSLFHCVGSTGSVRSWHYNDDVSHFQGEQIFGRCLWEQSLFWGVAHWLPSTVKIIPWTDEYFKPEKILLKVMMSRSYIIKNK
jgi:hypothetical protein